MHRTLGKPLPVPSTEPPLPEPFVPRIIFNGSEIHSIARYKQLDVDKPFAGLNDKARWDNPSRYPLTKVSKTPFSRQKHSAMSAA